MNVYAETTAVTPHFLENFQLLRDIQRLDERGVDEGHTSSDYPGHRGRPSRQCMLPLHCREWGGCTSFLVRCALRHYR